MITLLLDPEQLEGDRVEIAGDDYRHLFRARRLAVGERLRVVDGRGQARWAEVDQVERRSASLALAGSAPAHEPVYQLHLLVAALRAERASWLVEKATELGARSIRFISTQRTPRKYGAASLERWRRVAAAAVAQCHRSWLPEISGVDDREAWASWLRRRPKDCDRYYLHTATGAIGAASATGAASAAGATGAASATGDSVRWAARHGEGVVLIGPEGGWADDEATELENLGFQAISLGPRILRVETAAVVAAARLLLEGRS